MKDSQNSITNVVFRALNKESSSTMSRMHKQPSCTKKCIQGNTQQAIRMKAATLNTQLEHVNTLQGNHMASSNMDRNSDIDCQTELDKWSVPLNEVRECILVEPEVGTNTIRNLTAIKPKDKQTVCIVRGHNQGVAVQLGCTIRGHIEGTIVQTRGNEGDSNGDNTPPNNLSQHKGNGDRRRGFCTYQSSGAAT